MLLALVAGCGDDDDSGGEYTVEQFRSEYAQWFCEVSTPCCDDQGHEVNSKCVSSAEIVLTEVIPNASENVAYDGAAAAQCMQLIRGFTPTCDSSNSSDSPTESETVCSKVYTGKLAPGAKCDSSEECKATEGGDATCYAVYDSNGTSSKTCAVKYTAKTGEACSYEPNDKHEIYDCEDGNYCGFDGKCLAYAKLGESCTSAMCDENTYCDSTTSKCVAKKGSGEDCETFSECTSFSCVNNKCGEAQTGGADNLGDSPVSCVIPQTN